MEVYSDQLRSQQASSGGLTMFHQILSFLTLRQDVRTEQFTRETDNDKVAKVIFDETYLQYIRDKEQPVLNRDLSSAGPSSGQSEPNAKPGPTKLEYASIKLELKDDYLRRVSTANKRLQKRAE